MNRFFNPFITKGFVSDEYFCDRTQETKVLLNNVLNGVDTTLVSPRKYGKTGLILHFLDLLSRQFPNQYETIYADLFPTQNLDGLIKLLAEIILRQFPAQTTIGQRFLSFLKSIRPVFSYDSLTAQPQISLQIQSVSEKEHTLQGLFQFLNEQDLPVVLALDEFQQITSYPEKNVEALLRTCTQQLHNVRFIFCGSNHTMMTELFSNARHPFFSSTRMLYLDKIGQEPYANFITRLFHSRDIAVEDEAVTFILEWTRRHTFYTQNLCNYIYAKLPDVVDLITVKQACTELLEYNQNIYLQYRQVLTAAQWNFLIAVAKEDCVAQITSQSFLAKYGIHGTTSSRRTAQALVDKELLLALSSTSGVSHQVYDVMFSHWLARTY